MPWTAPTPEPVTGALDAPERELLTGFFDFYRMTLLNICAGLTPEQLAARPVPASNLSLLGLVRHLAKVERTWLRERAGGEQLEPMYARKDDDFDAVRAETAEADFARLYEERRLCDEAVRGLPLEHTFELRGEPMSLRATYLHLIHEYSRHNGHADLLRESIDGVTAR